MLDRILTAHSGVLRTRVLIEAGVSRHNIARAVRSGSLHRVRKGWVARPSADPQLVAAARQGLVLSCVTEARRLGIWSRERDPQHFAVPRPGAEVRPPGATLHYRKPLIPRVPYALTDPVENVLLLIAHCQPHEDAVAAWDAAQRKRLLDRGRLERLPLSAVARHVFNDSDPFADSGLESYVRIRLKVVRLPVTWQPWLLGHHVDFLIGDRLVLQIDGRDHMGEQRDSDNEHDAVLALHGYTVIRVSYVQVMSRWHEVHAMILEAIAQGKHVAR